MELVDNMFSGPYVFSTFIFAIYEEVISCFLFLLDRLAIGFLIPMSLVLFFRFHDVAYTTEMS